jgi:sugar phosphate isomerase/epimerase
LHDPFLTFSFDEAAILQGPDSRMNTSTELTRRSFLQTTATAALATGPLGLANPLLAAAPRWGVGCRDVHLNFVDKADSWAALRQIDADSFEADLDDKLALTSLVAPGKKYSIATPEGIAALRADLKANQRRISALCLHNKFDQRLEQEITLTTRVVQAAEHLDVPTVRIDVVPRALKLEEFLPFAIKACRAICDATRPSKIRFGIENHGKVTNDPDLMEQLIAGVGSDRLGITLDTANLYWWGHPLDEVYRIYERFAPRACHTHCKSIRYPDDKKNVKREMGWEYAKYNCPVYGGDIDFKRVVAILRKAGYHGDLCVENESLGRFPAGERAGILKREVAFLRALV